MTDLQLFRRFVTTGFWDFRVFSCFTGFLCKSSRITALLSLFVPEMPIFRPKAVIPGNTRIVDYSWRKADNSSKSGYFDRKVVSLVLKVVISEGTTVTFGLFGASPIFQGRSTRCTPWFLAATLKTLDHLREGPKTGKRRHFDRKTYENTTFSLFSAKNPDESSFRTGQRRA